MTTYNKKYTRIDHTQDEFDCRRYIKPGDMIHFDSMKACDIPNQVDRFASTIPYSGLVEAVYEKFVIVRLKTMSECVSRWNITKINDVHVGNGAGCFANLKPLEDAV